MILPLTFDADSATIRDALISIDRGAINVAFAVTADQILVGIVSDGDVRRALLQGSEMSDSVTPFIRKNPIVVSPLESRSSVLDLMKARGISQIPIINEQNQILGVHIMPELLGYVERSNVALILAGGRGTRLQPTTNFLPKPMIRVAGTPILERVLNHLVGYGIKQIVISIGYLGDVIEEYFKDGSRFGCEIKYARESPENPLGTGGPLSRLPSLFPESDDPILVMNGDLITQFDVAAMLAHHEQSGSVVTIGSLNYSHEIPYGVLHSGHSGEVIDIIEKPIRQELVSGGVYVIDASIPRLVPSNEFIPMTRILADCIQRNKKVTAWSLDEGWIDVGRPQDLARAQGVN